MKEAHKKRPHLATANSPPILADMGKIYFINLRNLFAKLKTKLTEKRTKRIYFNFHRYSWESNHRNI